MPLAAVREPFADPDWSCGDAMITVWFLLALSLTAASVYLTWFGIVERRANAPETFLNLLVLVGLFCASGAGIAWARLFRKLKG